MNAALYGSGRSTTGSGFSSIAAWVSGARKTCPASIWSIPISASSRRSGRTFSASSSPMRTRITSAPSSRCGRVCVRPFTPPASSIGLLETRAPAEPGAPKIDLHEIVAGQSPPDGAVRHRVRAGGSLDPGIECHGDPHRPSDWWCIRAIGRSTIPLSRQPHLRGEVPRPWATRASWPSSATSTNVVREGTAQAKPRSPRASPPSSRRPVPGCDHDFRVQRGASPVGRRCGADLRPRGGGRWPRDGPGRRRGKECGFWTICPNSATPTPSATCPATRWSHC